jgi:hypothetical protein
MLGELYFRGYIKGLRARQNIGKKKHYLKQIALNSKHTKDKT